MTPRVSGPPAQILHASTVALDDQALVILGPSGAGKSRLALELMALGADLVADDRTLLWPHAETSVPLAMAPPNLPAAIEARGVGLLPARLIGPVPVALVVDLGQTERDRLPISRDISFFGHKVALLHNPASGHFASALIQYLKCVRK